MTMNVVLVVFDTLRKDAVGSYGLTPPWEMTRIETPNLDALARESVQLTNAYPESLPTLCAPGDLHGHERTYPFHNGDFRALKGDFVGVAPGWGPIPNEQYTLSEILQTAGYRTALISDLYHQIKPSKNFWRGFDQWTFIRGQETDTARSGPGPTQEELDQFIPRSLQATFVRHPGGVGAGTTVDAWIQHHDIMPTILEALEIAPPEPVDGRSFWGTLLDGAPSSRDHVVIGWGTAMTVITDRWWFNAKIDGTGALLYDRTRPDGFDRNVADAEQAVCRELFGLGRAEAKDGFPELLLELAKSAADAPGCSPFAAG